MVNACPAASLLSGLPSSSPYRRTRYAISAPTTIAPATQSRPVTYTFMRRFRSPSGDNFTGPTR